MLRNLATLARAAQTVERLPGGPPDPDAVDEGRRKMRLAWTIDRMAESNAVPAAEMGVGYGGGLTGNGRSLSL